MFRWPKTRPEFWREKISGNIRRDIRNEDALKELGWRVGIVWECALKGPKRLPLEEVTVLISCLLTGTGEHFSIDGQFNKQELAAYRANVDDSGCSGVLPRACDFS